MDNSDQSETEEKTRVNICVLLLEHGNDSSNNDFEKEFGAVLVQKYKERVEEVLLKKKSEHYHVSIKSILYIK